MLSISSLSNPRVKAAAQLNDSKYRRLTGKFLIDSAKELTIALQYGVHIYEIFTSLTDDQLSDCPLFNAGIDPAALNNICQVTESIMRKIALGNSQTSVVAVAERPSLSLEKMESHLAGKEPLLAVLERVEKPGNAGAAVRSADGAGLDGVLFASTLADPFHPQAIRNSRGTVFSMPMACAETREVYDWLRERNYQIAAAWCNGNGIPYTQADFRKPTAIVLGSESDGLTLIWSSEGVVRISLPMLGAADSLNVSAAATTLFYEARRQRTRSGE